MICKYISYATLALGITCFIGYAALFVLRIIENQPYTFPAFWMIINIITIILSLSNIKLLNKLDN